MCKLPVHKARLLAGRKPCERKSASMLIVGLIIQNEYKTHDMLRSYGEFLGLALASRLRTTVHAFVLIGLQFGCKTAYAIIFPQSTGERATSFIDFIH